jgi:hypothetical protein
LDGDDEGSGYSDDNAEDDKEIDKYEEQSAGDDDKSSQFEADHQEVHTSSRYYRIILLPKMTLKFLLKF